MSTPSNLFPLNTRYALTDAKGLIASIFQKWLISLQMRLPLVTIDTGSGPIADAPPPPGVNSATGQSNQNQEIIYKKTSVDGNTYTLTGTANAPLPEGPLVLAAQYDFFRIKSDGTTWWKVG